MAAAGCLQGASICQSCVHMHWTAFSYVFGRTMAYTQYSSIGQIFNGFFNMRHLLNTHECKGTRSHNLEQGGNNTKKNEGTRLPTLIELVEYRVLVWLGTSLSRLPHFTLYVWDGRAPSLSYTHTQTTTLHDSEASGLSPHPSYHVSRHLGWKMTSPETQPQITTIS